MMASGECSLVRRTVAIGGGTVSAIRAIASSEMTPGPLGIAETRPNAEAPQPIASTASAGDLMQQILTLGRVCTGCVGAAPGRQVTNRLSFLAQLCVEASRELPHRDRVNIPA